MSLIPRKKKGWGKKEVWSPKKEKRKWRNKLTIKVKTLSLFLKGKKKKVKPGPSSTSTAGDASKHSVIVRLGAGVHPMLIFWGRGLSHWLRVRPFPVNKYFPGTGGTGFDVSSTHLHWGHYVDLWSFLVLVARGENSATPLSPPWTGHLTPHAVQEALTE